MVQIILNPLYDWGKKAHPLMKPSYVPPPSPDTRAPPVLRHSLSCSEIRALHSSWRDRLLHLSCSLALLEFLLPLPKRNSFSIKPEQTVE